MSVATDNVSASPAEALDWKATLQAAAATTKAVVSKDPPLTVLVVAQVALLAFVAWPILAFWHYAYFVETGGYYQHAPIIPFIVALMFWYRRDALKAVPLKPTMAAVPFLCLSLALLTFSVKMQVLAVGSTAFLLCVWLSVWALLGTAFVRAAAFPLAFLALMAPLPGPVLNDATQSIQMLSTRIADQLLHLMTFNTTRVGNVITMDSFILFVDVPCSGFKTLMAMATFSAAFAYLVDGHAKKRILLFLIALPLAVLVNSIRIALIGVVGDCISPAAGHHFHDWSGLIMLVVGFVFLFWLAKVFGCRKFAGWPIF